MLQRIFLDIETSGLDPKKDFIAEIGMVCADKSCLEHKDTILEILSCYNRSMTVVGLNKEFDNLGLTIIQHSLIAPPFDFEETACKEAFNVNGLDFKKLKKEVDHFVALEAFKSYFGSNHKYKIIGHNIYFEYSFLDKYAVFKDGGLANVTWDDTLRLSRKIVPNFPSHKLIYLCKRFKLWKDGVTGHSAIVDSVLTSLLYYHLIKLNKKSHNRE